MTSFARLALGFVAGLMLINTGTAQERGGGPKNAGPSECGREKTETGPYCLKCDKLLAKEEVDKDKCKTCNEKCLAVKVCVKQAYVCGCGKDCCIKNEPKPGKCKCNKDLVPKPDKARVEWSCDICQAKGAAKEGFKHGEHCTNKKGPRERCSSTGTCRSPRARRTSPSRANRVRCSAASASSWYPFASSSGPR